MVALPLLLALAAPPPLPPATANGPRSVLVLVSGQRMVVRSYRLDKRVVRIVGETGEPLVIRSEQVDLEASAAASASRAVELQAEEKADAERRAAEQRAADELERRAAERQERRSAGTGPRPGFMVSGAGSVPDPGAAPATEPAVEPAPSPTKGAAPDESYWRSRAAPHTGKIQRLEKEVAQRRAAYEEAELEFRKFMTLGRVRNHHGESMRRAKAELDSSERQLTSARKSYDRFKEEARKAGAKAGWLR